MKYLKQVDIENGMPLFKYIEIETLNRCNGLCSFCPVNAKQPQRPYAKMERRLFEKSLESLKNWTMMEIITYFQIMSLFLMREYWWKWMKYAWESLPKATSIMYTNGSQLDLEKFLETIKYTHKLVIDNYNNTPDKDQVSDNLKPIYEHLSEGERAKY